MIRLCSLLLILGGCSLAVSDIPDGGSFTAQADAQATTPQRPIPDVGPSNPNEDAGNEQSFDAGPRSEVPTCGAQQRLDEDSHLCVPLSGTTPVCRDAAALRRDHRWVRDAQSVLYAAPQAAGDGSGSDEATPTASRRWSPPPAQKPPPCFLRLEPTRSATRSRWRWRSFEAWLDRALQVTIELGAPMTTSGSVQLYGLAVRGPLSAEEGASNSAIIVSGSGTFKLVQSTVSAPAGHGVELTGAGSDAAVISGVTFGAVRDSALHATDALGSWTVTGNLSKGPIGGHAMAFAGGDAALTISSNRFEAISGDALRASDALGSWTIEGNLSKGPIGGDGISIAGGSAEAQVTINNNEFERIDGNGISAQDALGSWTIKGNLSRGPIGGHAMHFHNQSGAVAMTNNTVNGSARGVLVSGGSAAWTITGNTVGGGQAGQGPRGGVEFVGLSAQSTLSCTDNTLSHVGGVAMSFMNSKAAATVANNAINNAWGDQGGQLLSNQGIGLMAVDSSGLTIDGNTIQDNNFIGLLIDLAWWDTTQDGTAVITVRNNTVNGHGSRRNFKRQFIPQDATITNENNVIPPDGPDAPGSGPPPPVSVARGDSPAPPRCGDGAVDPGEACDGNDLGLGRGCKPDCTISHSVRQLTSHTREICGAHYDGTIRCLGMPGDQFGRQWDPQSDRNSFEAIPNTLDFRHVAIADIHGCGVKEDGRVWCWGNNATRQLGRGQAADEVLDLGPVDFPGLDNPQAYQDNPFVSVHTAGIGPTGHSCARQKQGQVWCWGSDGTIGVLGLGRAINNEPFSPQPIRRSDDQSILITDGFWTGLAFSCASVDGRYYCWGQSDMFASRVGEDENSGFRYRINLDGPVLGPGGQPLRAGGSLAIGLVHACALDNSGAAYCWGNNNRSQLGDRTTQNAYGSSVRVGNHRFSKLFAQPLHWLQLIASEVTCGLKADLSVWCWGQNDFGILGEFTQVDTPQRLQIPGLERVRELALSKTKACAIRWDDSVLCWGTDRYAGSNFASNQPLLPVELANSVLNNERPSFQPCRFR